jgi:TPR repeat protein
MRLSMNRFGWVLTLAFALLGTASAQDWWNKPAVTMGNQDMVLSEAEIQSYSQQALQGDIDAAGKLAGFYLIVQGNRSEAEKWYRISAENGSIGAQRGYGEMLIEDSKKSQNSQAKIRGMFWLKKAADGGDVFAKTELQKLSN